MRVGLFVPCYIDQLYPDVGLCTVEVLERLGVEVDYPDGQTCCGQPLANAGGAAAAVPLARRFSDLFAPYSHVVCPSASCVSTVRHHYNAWAPEAAGGAAPRTYELCEFIHDVLGIDKLSGSFPHRIGLHQSCHGLRELRLGPSSERPQSRERDKVRALLQSLDGATFAPLSRGDECCGFGGTFAVTEAAVSCAMGCDRIADHTNAGADVITATDMSCLMHMDGLIRRQRGRLPVMHVAQILAGRPLPRPENGA